MPCPVIDVCSDDTGASIGGVALPPVIEVCSIDTGAGAITDAGAIIGGVALPPIDVCSVDTGAMALPPTMEGASTDGIAAVGGVALPDIEFCSIDACAMLLPAACEGAATDANAGVGGVDNIADFCAEPAPPKPAGRLAKALGGVALLLGPGVHACVDVGTRGAGVDAAGMAWPCCGTPCEILAARAVGGTKGPSFFSVESGREVASLAFCFCS